MIPQTDINLNGVELGSEPSKNYAMRRNLKRIGDYVDGIEAVKQSVYKILNTERYQYLIYSSDYGVEFFDLLGEPVDFVCAEAERRIPEALLQDDRITDVSDFEFGVDRKGVVNVSFVVNTVFGKFEAEKAVNY